MKKKACGVKGCEKGTITRGLCKGHYARLLQYGDTYSEVALSCHGSGSLATMRKGLAAPAGFKFCTACEEFKPVAAFDKSKRHRSLYHCKSCRRSARLLGSYGITASDYAVMLKRQGNACALCKKRRPGNSGGRFAVDHDHNTGQVRGLLCRACNQLVIGIIERRDISIAQLRDYLAGKFAFDKANREEL